MGKFINTISPIQKSDITQRIEIRRTDNEVKSIAYFTYKRPRD